MLAAEIYIVALSVVEIVSIRNETYFQFELLERSKKTENPRKLVGSAHFSHAPQLLTSTGKQSERHLSVEIKT